MQASFSCLPLQEVHPATKGWGKITHPVLSIEKFDLFDFSTPRYSPPLVTQKKHSQETHSGKKHMIKIQVCFIVSLLNINLKGLGSQLSNLFPMSGVL